jgi:hypothetical protein
MRTFKSTLNGFLSCLILMAVLAPQYSPLQKSSSTPSAQPAAGAALMQFTSAGHVLAFRPDGVTIASASHALRITFAGAHPAQPAASRPAASASKAAALDRVTWQDLWDGISLTYQAAAGQIAESTYQLEPGAAVSQIRLQYNVPASINPDGSLSLQLAQGRMTETAPAAWQEVAGQRQSVPVAFAVRGDGNEVGFTLGRYDPAYPLTIDPTLEWNTFLGGTANDSGNAIALDSSGNTYVIGNSDAQWGNPGRHYTAGLDTFVVKLDSTGALLWLNFLGGTGADWGNGITVTSDGVFVTGISSATWGAPKIAFGGGSMDAYAAGLTTDGNLVWNTFLGGSGPDYGYGIVTDGAGFVDVLGTSCSTWGSPKASFSGGCDAFVAHLTGAGDLLWNTFLGGAGNDSGVAIAADTTNLYITGTSATSWGNPTLHAAGGEDVFAAKLTNAGALVWNAFLGGAGADQAKDIAVDKNGNVFVAGASDGAWGSLPVQPFTGGEDGFTAKLSASGALTWNTFLGGRGTDMANALSADAHGNLLVVGSSDSGWGTDPVDRYSGSTDAFAAKLDSSGRVLWNGFYGGVNNDAGSALTLDSLGNIYLSGVSGGYWGTQPDTFSGGNDGFAAKLNSSGKLSWSLFLGGTSSDAVWGVTVDADDNIYVTGYSMLNWSAFGPQPVQPFAGWSDAFVAKLDSSGALLWHTFLGGPDVSTVADQIVLDKYGFIYISGSSDGSWGTPVRPYGGNFNEDAFVAELNPNGVIQWTTFLGGSGYDTNSGLGLDNNGNIYVTGGSEAAWGSPKHAFQGYSDGFLARLNSNGALIWSTFVGASDYDDIIGLVVDGSGNSYISGLSGSSWGTPKRAYSGQDDGFVAKVNSNGVVQWNTFQGNADSDGDSKLIVAPGGEIYVIGDCPSTWGSPVMPMTHNTDVSVTKLNSDGTLAWNTFVGKSLYNRGSDLALSGNTLYVVGYTADVDQTKSYDILLAGVDAASGTFHSSESFSSPGSDEGVALAVLSNGNLVMVGQSNYPWGPGLYSYSGGYDGFVSVLDTKSHLYLPSVLK